MGTLIIVPFSSEAAKQFQAAIRPIPNPEDIEETFSDPITGNVCAGVLVFNDNPEVSCIIDRDGEVTLECTIIHNYQTEWEAAYYANFSRHWWPCVTRFFERDGCQTMHILELPVEWFGDSWEAYENRDAPTCTCPYMT